MKTQYYVIRKLFSRAQQLSSTVGDSSMVTTHEGDGQFSYTQSLHLPLRKFQLGTWLQSGKDYVSQFPLLCAQLLAAVQEDLCAPSKRLWPSAFPFSPGCWLECRPGVGSGSHVLSVEEEAQVLDSYGASHPALPICTSA